MRSMTGFGQASGADARHRVAVALRSVNGRFLDLALRLEPELRGLEPELRRQLEAELFRGRVEVSLEVRRLQPAAVQVEVRAEVVGALHAAFRDLARRGLIQGELTPGDLLSVPEVVEVRRDDDGQGGVALSLIQGVVQTALDQLLTARRHEGGELRRLLEERLEQLSALLEALRGRVEEVRAALREGLRRRLQELLTEIPLDEGRLAQEAALLADRGDVAEEIDRLGAHLSHFRSAMREPGPVGKRLDFLTQEILRELNTVGSKARDPGTTRLVVDGKVLCEQLREQVQNVE
jgi:uncharacterized protein (TIGR00255 family)